MVAVTPRVNSPLTQRNTARVESRGAIARALECRDEEILISGPAGTGKTIGLLWKMHACALKYPGMRGLMARKTNTSLSASALVSYQKYVLGSGKYGVTFFGGSKLKPAQFEYPNGSVIVVGGMDKPEKILSTEYDLAYINEATELTLNDHESLTGRMRNGVMPYQQIMEDCNPGPPTHWLYQRVKSGLTTIFYSTHKDNPAYWDDRVGEWTVPGQKYLDRLSKLTGVRRARFFEGKWISAEGVVYDNWRPEIHLIDRFEIPKHWERIWVIDFGYTNPFVWQAWARDPDGRLIRYREVYMTQRIVEDHAAQIMEITKDEPAPIDVIADHDAEDRKTFERKTGLRTIAAKKDVSPGIQAVSSRLREAGDGKPRLMLMRDSLVERDPDRVDAGLPTCTEEEMDSYVWDTRTAKAKESPLKENDHGCDTTRYAVAYYDLGKSADLPAPVSISQVSKWRQ